jgi:hypothetical protein
MKILRGAAIGLCTVLLCTTLTPGVRASDWNKKTIVTFSDSVQIPGQVLAPGTYIFKLANSMANRHIVEVWNEDGNQLIATVLTIPSVRFEPPNETVFELDERPADEPMAVKVWYFPGSSTGEEFVYPNYSANPDYSTNPPSTYNQ